MKDGHFIGLHTQARYWLPLNGKYTELEALVSHTLDINDNKSWSISGYSKLWGWSRTRVKNFLHNVKTTGGHHKDIHQDNLRASRGQGVVIKINNLHLKEDKAETKRRQSEDIPKTSGEQYYNKKNNTNKKKNKTDNRRAFVKPTLEEVSGYCHERGNSVDPEAWMDHYTSNGWMVGKNKMKCWKSAVRTWERNNMNNGNGKQSPKELRAIERKKAQDEIRGL